MIIPLGPGSLPDSSSLPEGQSAALLRAQHVRAGPALPSYLALLHAGFSVPRMSPPGRWALTPPFHPCQVHSTVRGVSLVLPKTCRRGASITGGFIFCGTFRSRVPCGELTSAHFDSGTSPLALPGALPFTLRNCQWQLPRVVGVRTFLPPASLSRNKPTITRLTRHCKLYPVGCDAGLHNCAKFDMRRGRGRLGDVRPSRLQFHVAGTCSAPGRAEQHRQRARVRGRDAGDYRRRLG